MRYFVYNGIHHWHCLVFQFFFPFIFNKALDLFGCHFLAVAAAAAVASSHGSRRGRRN